MEYRINEIADALPMVSDGKLQELADDIKANGLIESIKLWNDEIIDGRNRYAACKLAGVEPRFDTIQIDDPVSYVTSTNVRRRHLTKEQIALFLAFATKVMSREAVSAKANGVKYGKSSNVSNDTMEKSDEERAADAGISRSTLARARKMVEEEPEKARTILNGEKPKVSDDLSNGQKAAMAYDGLQSGLFSNTQEAAQECDVHGRRVAEYVNVVDANPALAEQVKSGETSLAQALKEIKAKPSKGSAMEELFARLGKRDQRTIEKQFESDLEEMRKRLTKEMRERYVDEAYEHRMENVRLKTEFVRLFDRAEWCLPWTEKEYKSLVMFCHPDRHPEDMKEKASTAFQLLKEMERRYEVCNMLKFRKEEAA